MIIKSREISPPDSLAEQIMQLALERKNLTSLARTLKDIAVLQNDDVMTTVLVDAADEINQATITMNNTQIEIIQYFNQLNKD